MAIETTKTSPRFYFDTDAPEVKYPGVTSITGMLPKPFLQRWNANMAAAHAVANADRIAEMAEDDREGALRWIAGAAYRYTKERSRIGTAAHKHFEDMITGRDARFVSMEMGPYVHNFTEFLDAVQPELVRSEDVAWSDTHHYAGRFDAILRIRLNEAGKPDASGALATVMVDWKTGKSVYPEVALQMSAYANADKIISLDGTSSPVPELDGACVLHITDSAWEFTPVVIDDAVFAEFLALRSTFHWDRHIAKTVLGDHIATSKGVAKS